MLVPTPLRAPKCCICELYRVLPTLMPASHAPSRTCRRYGKASSRPATKAGSKSSPVIMSSSSSQQALLRGSASGSDLRVTVSAGGEGAAAKV